MSKVKLIIVGGFLGAGKTTLLARTRRELAAQGKKCGLVTNDQAPDLVDTIWLSDDLGAVREVSGSCFCCNFNGFAAALQNLAEQGAEVIIAEPVGSCTDLSATILQPLKDKHGLEYDPAPFTVLLDPDRAREVLGLKKSSLHPDALYILERQLAEADRILLNKADLLSEEQINDLRAGLESSFPGAAPRAISARAGRGVPEWLADMLSAKEAAGGRLIEVDYDRYANGEAVLGWLNLRADTPPAAAADGVGYLSDFMNRLRWKLLDTGFEVGHVKVLLSSPQGRYMVNLIDNEREPVISTVDGDPGAESGDLIINARVECEPEALEKLVRETLAEAKPTGAPPLVKEIHCLKPGRPNPTYRYDQVI